MPRNGAKVALRTLRGALSTHGGGHSQWRERARPVHASQPIALGTPLRKSRLKDGVARIKEAMSSGYKI